MMAEPPIKLAVFDMEGCLTDNPTVWEIMHRKLGTWESHGLPYWDRYRAGELDYDKFARMDVAAWRGAPAGLLDDAAAEVPLMRGCAELMAALHAAGVRAALISNGLVCVAERFRRDFGVEHVHANRALTRDGRLTGEIRMDVPHDDKGDVLRALAARLDVTPAETVAVGDSVADVAMFRAAGTSVAFCPADPSVSAAATHTVRDKDLRPLIRILARAGTPPLHSALGALNSPPAE